MFESARAKKLAKDIGRTVTEKIASETPCSRDQVQKILCAIDRVAGDNQNWQTEIPFALNAMAFCSLIGHPAGESIAEGLAEAMTRLHPECRFVDSARPEMIALRLHGTAILINFKTRNRSHDSAEVSCVCAFVDAIDSGLGERFRENCSPDSIRDLARVLERTIATAQWCEQKYRVI